MSDEIVEQPDAEKTITDTVTITIRREDARYMAKLPQMHPAEARISLACRVALYGGK